LQGHGGGRERQQGGSFWKMKKEKSKF